jgi:hypothetical protein
MLPLVGWESDIGLPHGVPAVPDLFIDGARLADVLAAGDLGGFAENAVYALRDQLVIHIADSRARAQPGGGVALAAFGGYPQIGNRTLLALQFGCPVNKFLGLARGIHDGLQIAVLLDGKAGHRLAGCRNAVDDLLRPAGLDADDDAGRDIGIGAGADHGAEMQIEILAELQPAIGMRQGHGALDVVADRFAGGVGNVVKRQNDDMIADADAAVFAPVGMNCCVAVHC